jgi:hypothetical protein
MPRLGFFEQEAMDFEQEVTEETEVYLKLL